MMWYLHDSLALIRKLEKVALGYGFNLFLGGGVLIRGHSNKDLDILAVSRNRVTVSRILFLEYLERSLGWDRTRIMHFPDRDTYHYTIKTEDDDLSYKRIDLAVIEYAESDN